MASEADTSIDAAPDWMADDDETEAPQGSDTDAPSADDESASQPPPSDETPSRPRDVTGRFQRTSVTPQSPLGGPRPSPASPSTDPTAPGALAGAPAEPPVFSYKADGREYKIPGLVVPDSHAEQVRQLLSEGMHHRTTWQQERAAFTQEVTKAEQSIAFRQAQVDFLSKTLIEAFNDPDKLAQMYANWQQEGPVFVERAKQAALEAELNTYRGQESQQFEQAAAEAKQTYLWQSVERTVGEKFPGLFDETSLAAVVGELAPLGLIQVADRDYPEWGYTRGDVILNEAELLGHLAKAAEVRQQAKSTQELAAEKVAKVAARNAAVLNGNRKAPPVVSARTGQAPSRPPAKPVTAKDWRTWVETDDE